MFFIRTFKLDVDPEGELFNIDDVILRERTVGFFRRMEEAFLAVSNNRMDIFEDGYYNYAVIERVGQGLYPRVNELQWFFYDYQDRSVLTVTRPAILGIEHGNNNILAPVVG